MTPASYNLDDVNITVWKAIENKKGEIVQINDIVYTYTYTDDFGVISPERTVKHDFTLAPAGIGFNCFFNGQCVMLSSDGISADNTVYADILAWFRIIVSAIL